MSWEKNLQVREEKRNIIHELEDVITKKLSNYYFRKIYDGPSLLVIPKGKTIRESYFHLQVISNKIECELHSDSLKEPFVFQLREKGYLKRKDSTKLVFDTVDDFKKFIEEFIV